MNIMHKIAKSQLFLGTLALIILGSVAFIGNVATGTNQQGGVLDSLKQLFTGPTSPTSSNAALYQPVLDYERAVIAAVKKASPAVVSITISKNVPIIENCPTGPFSDLPPEFQQLFGRDFSTRCQTGTELREVGGGSGFIISADGLVVTNKHVVSDTQASYTVFTNDGKKYDARVLARDPVQDIAVVKIEASGLPTVELGDSDGVELGQTAIAIGNALGEFRNTVSVGTISGLARTVTASGGGIASEVLQGVMQTDAAINQGNSGGPLLNLNGQVIGINTAVASGAQNIGFAIPINKAKRDIDSVRRTGTIETPYLGVRYVAITPEIARQRNLSVEYGALVQGGSDGVGVSASSPAETAGVREGDVILELNGVRIDRDNLLGVAITQFNVGDSVRLKILRGNEELTLNATLTKRP